MMFDPRVSMFDVDVTVADGTVTLTGSVNNVAARSAAEDIARNTIGVSIVHDLINVRPDKLFTNESLAAKVRSAIERDPYLNGEEVNVRVLNSEVTLLGEVETKFEKNHATDVVERIAGVAAVKNRLTFPPYETGKSDWAIKDDIETMLYWTPELNANDINVEVKNGTVTLTGTVDTWRQSFIAVNKAYEAGADDVQDDLAVSYGHIPFYSWY
jgi:osmotically-inducible protein OsmY